MAKVTVTGNAVVVTSDCRFEDLKLVKKYRPDALKLYKGEGKDKEQVFAIGLGTAGNGDLSKYGAEFCQATHDENKYAVITMLHEFKGDVKEEISDFLGTSILKLNELEATIPGVIEEIKAEKDEIMSSVTLV